MGSRIHPSAVISRGAEIADGVEIGPNAIIEEHVKIGPGTRVWANAYVTGWTEIGSQCEIHMGAVIGHLPQDRAFGGGESYLKIGDRNILREYCTVHRGTIPGSATIIGDGNFIMGLSHIAHNVRIGNNVTLCNCALLAGHVTVDDGAFLSGSACVHQFVKIGRLAMISGLTRVTKDVPPFMLVEGDSLVHGMNVVGLRRAGYDSQRRLEIKRAYKVLYGSGLNTSQALARLESEFTSADVGEIVRFIKNAKRGVCRSCHSREGGNPG